MLETYYANKSNLQCYETFPGMHQETTHLYQDDISVLSGYFQRQ